MSTPLDPLAAKVRSALYRSLGATGKAPDVAELAETLDMDPESIEQTLTRLENARALVLAPTSKHLWMAHPFSAVPTDFRIQSGELSYWANCAWDGFAIPPLLRIDAELQAHCADCGDALTFNFREGELSDGGRSFVHFVVPPTKFWDNVGFT